MALDFDGLSKAQDVLSKGQEAVSTGQEVYQTGSEAVEKGREFLNNRGSDPVAGSGSARVNSLGGPVLVSRDEGGPTRLIAVLGEGLTSNTSTTGKPLLGLLDRGVYFVQRQSAYVTADQGQVLLLPRGDSTTLTIDLPAHPTGMVFDLTSGRSSGAGRGVRIYALSAYGDIPLRRDRRALDAIEQHANLRASSVNMEWPRNPQDVLEPVGGKLLVHATETGVAFPSGFGVDGKLFTKDDPMVTLTKGYTVVTLDPRGFVFDRSREVVMPFYPVMPPAGIDLSRLGYADALQAFCSLMSERYPYRESRPIDWAQLQAEMLPRANRAGASQDGVAYAQIFADIGQRIRDGQYRVRLANGSDPRARDGLLQDRGLSAQMQVRGDVLLPMPRVWMTNDGKGFVTDVASGSAAALAGLHPGAEVLEVEGDSFARYVERNAPLSNKGTDAARRLEVQSLQLTAKDTLRLRVRQDGVEQNLDLRVTREVAPPTSSQATQMAQLESSFAAFQLRSAKGADYGYVAFNSFADANGKLDTWERTLAGLNRARLPGLVLDLRGVTGSSYQLVAHFIAGFFSYDVPFRPQFYAQRQLDAGSKVWRSRGGLGLPPQLPLFNQDDIRYRGRLVLLTGRECSGPCELFASWLQHAERAHVVATEATAGEAGRTTLVSLPAGVNVRLPVLAEIASFGENYVQGKGVEPNLRVPLDPRFIARLTSGGDPVLDAAVVWLDGILPTRH